MTLAATIATTVSDVYDESQAIRLATVITPPRRSRSKHYDLRTLPFMDIEAEECNVRVCDNKENIDNRIE
jgi:hypothetical protein